MVPTEQGKNTKSGARGAGNVGAAGSAVHIDLCARLRWCVLCHPPAAGSGGRVRQVRGKAGNDALIRRDRDGGRVGR